VVDSISNLSGVAWDVVRPETTIEIDSVTDTGSACLTAFDIDATNFTDLDGQQLGYGFTTDLAGHVPALMLEYPSKGWLPAGTAEYRVETDQVFSYSFGEELIAY
jgi:hypothetical protein